MINLELFMKIKTFLDDVPKIPSELLKEKAKNLSDQMGTIDTIHDDLFNKMNTVAVFQPLNHKG